MEKQISRTPALCNWARTSPSSPFQTSRNVKFQDPGFSIKAKVQSKATEARRYVSHHRLLQRNVQLNQAARIPEWAWAQTVAAISGGPVSAYDVTAANPSLGGDLARDDKSGWVSLGSLFARDLVQSRPWEAVTAGESGLAIRSLLPATDGD
ncbi:hypothetical protein BJ508DRAFT_102834 [Ascobolus immersus RN42]|uniref:Uncharacterized protein n=1 Tax=Ascobolus immersus RN42 TaxID=1160509 RepID=A0A3N4I7A5_ASCIM|nr:hypothetical protein BJ508DRAFT_102834 [Ascobolus immersus RN42]